MEDGEGTAFPIFLLRARATLFILGLSRGWGTGSSWDVIMSSVLKD